jgi:GNAT superfamily N-acetyltransferase
MHSTVVTTRAGRVTIRPLRNGDETTVLAVFDALGAESRRLRFGYPKHDLKPDELDLLARVDSTHHVLVAWRDGKPLGIARLVRDGVGAPAGEIAVAVVDSRQGRGIGTALMRLLVQDAAAAGITHVRALVSLGSPSMSIISKVATVVGRQFAAGQLELLARTA